MSLLLTAWLVCSVAGVLLPLGIPGRPRAQNFLAHGLASLACLAGAALGLAGLFAGEPLAVEIPSSVPFLVFALRIDPLAAFFVLTISVVGLAVSVYALGYLAEYYGRASLGDRKSVV